MRNPPKFWNIILFGIPDLERHVRSETHLKPQNVSGTMILGLLKLADLRNSWNIDIFTYWCACYVQTKVYNMISSKILRRNSIKFLRFLYGSHMTWFIIDVQNPLGGGKYRRYFPPPNFGMNILPWSVRYDFVFFSRK